jgi:protein SCO1/2
MTKPSRFSRHSGSLLIAGIAILGAIFGQWLYHATQDEAPDLTKLNATVFSTPRTVSPFNLLDHRGNTFTEANLPGQWSFVFFGYTNCPDVCPSTLTMLNLMLKAVSNQTNDIPLPRVMMVSVDPERDTVEQLGKYMPYFNKAFIGLTAASQTDVDAITKQFGIAYLLNKKSPADQEYSVEHSGAILLINPQGRLHALFSAPHDPLSMANEFAIIRGIHE